MSTLECKLERSDPLHTPLPHHTYSTLSDSHTHTQTLSLLIFSATLGQGLSDPVKFVHLCVCICVLCRDRTEQQSELRLCDQLRNEKQSHRCSCCPALRGFPLWQRTNTGAQTEDFHYCHCRLPPLLAVIKGFLLRQEDTTTLSGFVCCVHSPSCLARGWGWRSCLCVRTPTWGRSWLCWHVAATLFCHLGSRRGWKPSSKDRQVFCQCSIEQIGCSGLWDGLWIDSGICELNVLVFRMHWCTNEYNGLFTMTNCIVSCSK